MLANYVKVALRSLQRHKLYALVNVVGLAVGLSVCALIYLFVQDELAYDQYDGRLDRTYRVVDTDHAALVAPFIPVAAAEVSDIETAARVYPMIWSKPLIRHDDAAFYESRVFFVDSTFFDVFAYRMKHGVAKNALARPFTAVLTESTARRYFGDADPVGRSILYDNTHEFEVTGVVENPHRRSHLQFDILFSFAAMYELEEAWGVPMTWSNSSFHGYLRLAEGRQPAAVSPKLNEAFLRHAKSDSEPDFRLQPVSDIHLRPVAHDEFSARGDITYVFVFGSMAILVLVIACANFTNLATAQSTLRSREVGLRKALGAMRAQLVRQFLGESVLMSFLALILAAVLIGVFLPGFNSIAGKSLTTDDAFGLREVAFLLGITVFAGLFGGVYPALCLSKFHSADIVKSGEAPTGKGAGLRKTMVVGQFAVAILLLAGTLIAAKQLHYLQNRDTGLTTDQMVVVPMTDRSLIPRSQALEDAMADHPRVLGVSTSHRVPGETTNGFRVRREGRDPIVAREFGIDDDFLSTYDIELLAGRAFRDGGIDQEGETTMINRSALQALGWADPAQAIGQTILFGDGPKLIVGVFENFNFRSLHHPVRPLVLNYYGFRMYLSLRIAPGSVRETIDHIRSTWAAFSPGFPFDFYFLDQRLDEQYRAEQRIDELFKIFAALSLLIGCLGLFGLSAFTAQRRAKEVGIRKALGASVSELVRMFSAEYTKLLLVAWLVAAPIAWYAAHSWLGGFAYQADIGVWPYVAAGFVTLCIAWITVSYHSVRTASTNPVETLRYE